jgi:hypothetical protein
MTFQDLLEVDGGSLAKEIMHCASCSGDIWLVKKLLAAGMPLENIEGYEKCATTGGFGFWKLRFGKNVDRDGGYSH